MNLLSRCLFLVAVALPLVGCMGSDGEQEPASVTSPPASSPGAGPSPSTAQAVAELQWDAVTASDLAGYRVYFGTAPRNYAQRRGQGLEAGRTPSYTVSNLQRGATYYFAVTSYDFAGNESDYSAEVWKRID